MCILQENVTEVTHLQLHYYDANDVIEKCMCQCLPFEDIKIKTGGQICSTYEHYVWKFLNPL